MVFSKAKKLQIEAVNKIYYDYKIIRNADTTFLLASTLVHYGQKERAITILRKYAEAKSP